MDRRREGGQAFSKLLSFLGDFANCANRLLASSCLSVRPSAWNNWAPTGRIFMEFDILNIFQTYIEEIQV